MLPRMGSIESVGSSASSWAFRRTDAVPTRMPGTQLASATERVARILSLQVRTDRKAFGIRRGHVLRGVHGNVDATVEQRLLQLLDEDTTSSDLAEGTRAVTVARCRDGNERDLDTRRAQPRCSELGLREREPTAAGTDADQHGTNCA